MKSSVFTKRCFERSVEGFKIRARYFECSYVGDEQNDTIGLTSGEASPTFGHANANFSVFIDRIRNQFVKK